MCAGLYGHPVFHFYATYDQARNNNWFLVSDVLLLSFNFSTDSENDMESSNEN